MMNHMKSVRPCTSSIIYDRRISVCVLFDRFRFHVKLSITAATVNSMLHTLEANVKIRCELVKLEACLVLTQRLLDKRAYIT